MIRKRSVRLYPDWSILWYTFRVPAKGRQEENGGLNDENTDCLRCLFSYYERRDELHFRDFEVISTKLLSPADLEALRGMPGVAAGAVSASLVTTGSSLRPSMGLPLLISAPHP